MRTANSCPFRRALRNGAALLQDGRSFPGQIDRKSAAFSELALDLNVPAQLLHGAINRGKPQPCSLSSLLGGEERFENFLLHVGRHSHTRIRHAERRVTSRLRTWMRLRVGRIELGVASHNREDAT